MALVANYGSDEDLSAGSEDEAQPSAVEDKPNDDIEDLDEQDEDQLRSVVDEALDQDDMNIPGLSSSTGLNLPSMSSNSDSTSKKGASSFVDADEDMSTIPVAKEKEKALIPLRPDMSKKRNKGKVRIVLPSLDNFDDQNEDGDKPQVKRFKGAEEAKKSALLGMLPAPKNMSLGVKAAPKAEVPVKAKVSRPLIPHAVARKMAEKKVPGKSKEDSDSDDDSPSSFFTLDTPKVSAIPAPLPTVTPSTSASVEKVSVAPDLKEDEVAGPSVGPSRPQFSSEMQNSYPDVSDVMTNTAALERLAGKNALKGPRPESFDDVIEVNASNLTADPREWITKALTEEDADKPGPKNTVKGNQKRKHQITYLAAMAKENEHKLRQQWANNAAARKASGNKYGF